MPIIEALMAGAFSSGRLSVVQTPSGYALLVRYFGMTLNLGEVSTADAQRLTRPQLRPVS